MKYTRDNIKNLRVRRGGTEEYVITQVFSTEIVMKMVRNRRNYFSNLDFGLKRLNIGKWTVTGEGFPEKQDKVELTYEIY